MASSIYRDEQEGLRLRAQDLSLQIGEREARLTDAFWDAIPRMLSERLRELHRDAAAPHEEPAAAVADLEAYLATLDDALAQVPCLEVAGRLLPATAPHMMFPFEHQVGFASATRDFDAAGVGFMAALADFPGASLDSDYLRGWHRARFEWKGAPFVAGLAYQKSGDEIALTAVALATSVASATPSLTLQEQTYGDDFLKVLGLRNDVDVGDMTFDALFFVKGESAREMLTAEVRASLLAVANYAMPRLVVGDGVARLDWPYSLERAMFAAGVAALGALRRAPLSNVLLR